MAAQPVLWVLVLSVLVLFVLAVILGGYAIALRVRNSRKAARWSALEAAWEPVILDVLAGAAEPGALHAQIGRRDELFFVGFLMRYAKRLAGPERDTVRSLASPYLRRVGADLGDRDPERRARAVNTLAVLGLPEYADLVTLALDDPSPLVAMTAARALTNRSHPQYLGAVMDRLHRFTNWSSGFLSAMLAAVGPSAAPALRDTLSDRKRPDAVRAVAADALALLNDLAAGDTAAAVLAEAPHADVATSCLRLLGKVGRPEHLEIVRRLLASPHDSVRAFAASTLGRLGDAGDVPRLRALVDDPSRWVAIHAAQGLAAAGATAVLNELEASEHPRAALARELRADPVR